MLKKGGKKESGTTGKSKEGRCNQLYSMCTTVLTGLSPSEGNKEKDTLKKKIQKEPADCKSSLAERRMTVTTPGTIGADPVFSVDPRSGGREQFLGKREGAKRIQWGRRGVSDLLRARPPSTYP